MIICSRPSCRITLPIFSLDEVDLGLRLFGLAFLERFTIPGRFELDDTVAVLVAEVFLNIWWFLAEA